MIPRLLVVEDDLELVPLLQLSLVDIGGLEACHYNDGTSALGALDDGLDPDLALLDFNLPDMTGTELIRHIRSRGHARFPIVFLTGMTGRGVGDNLRSLGADGILEKPFDPMKLAQDVRLFLPDR